MDRETAKKVIEALAWMEFPLNKLSSEAWGDPPEVDSNSKLYDHFGSLIQAHFSLLMHVINQYPEFDPDGEGEKLYEQFKIKHQTEEYPYIKSTPEEIRSAKEAGQKARKEIDRNNDA